MQALSSKPGLPGGRKHGEGKRKQEFGTTILHRAARIFRSGIRTLVLKAEPDVIRAGARLHGHAALRHPYWELIQAAMVIALQGNRARELAMPHLLIRNPCCSRKPSTWKVFAPEVAWVTQGGSEVLTSAWPSRPTSETMFCTMYARGYNPGATCHEVTTSGGSRMRWRRPPAPSCAPASSGGRRPHHARHRRGGPGGDLQMLEVYREVCEDVLAMAGVCRAERATRKSSPVPGLPIRWRP